MSTRARKPAAADGGTGLIRVPQPWYTSYHGCPQIDPAIHRPIRISRGNARWPRPYSASEVWLPLLAPTRDMHGMGQEKFGDRYREAKRRRAAGDLGSINRPIVPRPEVFTSLGALGISGPKSSRLVFGYPRA